MIDPERPQGEYGEEKETIKVLPIEQLIPDISPYKKVGFEKLSPAPDTTTPRSEAILECIENEKHRDLILKFLKPLKGQIVVDIGAGTNHNGYMIIAAAEARGYVGIEPYSENFERLESEFSDSRGINYTEWRLKNLNKHPIPVTLIQQDALSFLKRLPDNSVSIFASGIDRFIIDNTKYIREVEFEIQRVLAQEGAFINYDSAFHLNPDNFKVNNPPQEAMRSPSRFLTKYTKKLQD